MQVIYDLQGFIRLIDATMVFALSLLLLFIINFVQIEVTYK